MSEVVESVSPAALSAILPCSPGLLVGSVASELPLWGEIGANGVMTCVFDGYTFTFGGVELTSADVFSETGFFPYFADQAAKRINDLFGISVELNVVENENAIFGLSSNLSSSCANEIMFMLQVLSLAQEVFGDQPCEIDLDSLYDYATDQERQRNDGIPFLGRMN